MKTAPEWSKECIRQFGYGVNHDLIRQVQLDTLRSVPQCGDPLLDEQRLSALIERIEQERTKK